MIKDYALIKDGRVAQVIVADAGFVAGIQDMWDHIEPASAGAGVGWAWTAEGFTPPPPGPPPPPPPAPHTCTRRQGQLALLSYGLLDDAEAAIAAIADPMDRRAAQIEYDADTWERSNPFLVQLWTQIGGTPASLDEAFALAVTL